MYIGPPAEVQLVVISLCVAALRFNHFSHNKSMLKNDILVHD